MDKNYTEKTALIMVFSLALSLTTGCLFNLELNKTDTGLDASFSTDNPGQQAANDKTSAYGKYSGFISRHSIPEDARQYGSYYDYGYWGGGTWKGIPNLPAGYWVYVEPVWYVWRTKN